MICITDCGKCKNKLPKIDGWRSCCKAFPDGIPLDFDYSKVKEIVECNNGIGFEPIKEKDTDFIMNDEYICDDRPVEESRRVSAMTGEEVEKEFDILFGKYSKDEE